MTPTRMGVKASIHRIVARIHRTVRPSRRLRDQQHTDEWQAILRRMNILPFHWKAGGRLPFEDGKFSFIFSEHFFEHIFLDEAFDLFVECRRVLSPSGILRISVPDADLRTYAKPEPVKFDARLGKTGKVSWTHPDIHKTRWNIYSLSLLLRIVGFRVVPLVYCDKDGNFVSRFPQRGDSSYPPDADWEMLCSKAYLLREKSLIVDAVRC
jgi:predicted SAM-dependent methyltransferase